MAAVTHAIETASTANASTYASGAFTPAAGDLLLAFAVVSATAQLPGAMTASANGITFTQVATAASGGGAHMLYCWVANQLVGASPVSMTVTQDVTGDAGTGCIIEVARISGMTNTGSAAIRQSAKQENQSTGTPAPTFASACLTTNPTLGAVNQETGPTTNSAVPPSGTTERGDIGFITPAHSLEYWSRDSGFTGTTVTWTSIAASIFADIVVELDASGGAAPQAFAPDTAQDRSSTMDERQRYLPPKSFTAMPFDVPAAVVQAFVPNTQSRNVPDYQSPKSLVVNVYDPAAGSQRDWVPNAVTDSPVPFYRAKPSVINVYDQPAVIPAAFASVIQSRQVENYRGSYSAVSGAADEPIPIAPVNDWTLVVQGNRRPLVYSPPPSRVIWVSDQAQAVAPDVWAALVQSRRVPPYAPPRGLVVPVYGVAAVDAWAAVVSAPGRPFYDAPASRVLAAFDQPAVVVGTEWVQTAQSRAVPYYLGSHSLAVAAADELIADPWAAVYQSRPVPYYDPPRTQIVPVFDQPPLVFGTEWTPNVQSRPVENYQGGPSRVFPAFDQPPLVFGTELALVTQSPRVRWREYKSLVIPVYDQPVVAPTDTWASVTQSSRIVVPKPGRSLVITPMLSEFGYAAVFQSAAQPFYAPPPSSVVMPTSAPVIAADAYAFMVQSARRLAYGAPPSRVMMAYPALLQQGYVPVAQSRATLPQIARISLTIFPRDFVVPVTPPGQQGGGGEWIIWGKPDFPANRKGAWPEFPRPYFRRPSRRIN